MKQYLRIFLIVILSSCMAQSALSQEEKTDWTDRISPYGDLRLRYEAIDEETFDGRERTRYRARIGLKADVVDNVKVIFELCSGGNNPVSCNVSFDGGFSSQEININLAYVDWAATDAINVYGGKMKNPLFRAGKAPMIWDGDLNPEGLATKISAGAFFGTAAVFSVEERAVSDDTLLYAAQIGTKFGIGEKSRLTAGIGYFGFTNTIGNEPFFFGIPLGNSVDENGDYIYEYKDVELFAQFDSKLGKWPVQLYGQYAENQEVSDGNTAYAVGASIGALKDKGTMALSWTYMDIEADAVVATFNDSDFAGGVTNSSGHLIRLGYSLHKNIALGGTFFVNQVQRLIGEKHDYNRMQLDILFKFN